MLENDREFQGLNKVQWGVVHLHKTKFDLMCTGLFSSKPYRSLPGLLEGEESALATVHVAPDWRLKTLKAFTKLFETGLKNPHSASYSAFLLMFVLHEKGR